MTAENTTPHYDEEWEDAVRKMPPMKCGRLDMNTYSLTGEMQRFMYVDDSERTLVEGPYCDEIAYAAQRYPTLQAEVERLKEENKKLKEEAARHIGLLVKAHCALQEEGE